MNRKHHMTAGCFFSRLLLVVLLLLTFFPLLVMINMSLKQSVMITNDFFGLPRFLYWQNYQKAFDFVIRPIGNSIYICVISLIGILIMVSLSGYALGKMKFKGRNFVYMAIMAVMMIPYTLLIVPNYNIVSDMGLLNTFWSVIIPYMSGQQIFGIIIAESFYRELPKDIFEAARIDGANDIQLFAKVALPLSKPILITVGITAVVAMYNDYIWPTITITSGDELKTFCQIVFNNAAGKGSNDLGLIAASFVIGAIPLLVATSSCLKYYVQGMMVGSVKG